MTSDVPMISVATTNAKESRLVERSSGLVAGWSLRDGSSSGFVVLQPGDFAAAVSAGDFHFGGRAVQATCLTAFSPPNGFGARAAHSGSSRHWLSTRKR